MTRYLRPVNLAEALQMRADYPEFAVFAGGTDLMVGALDRPVLAGMLDIFGLDELVGVRQEFDLIRIGAATTYAQLIRDPLVNQYLPSLCAAASEVGAVQVQARGTIGGNVANSSPVGDMLPVLLALDARVVLASPVAERHVHYRDFCTGYRQTVLKEGELIVAFLISMPTSRAFQYWRKVGTRSAQATSKVMVAGYGEVVNTRVTRARVGIGAVADRPIRLTPVEEFLVGARIDASLIDRARELTLESIEPISDVRSTRSYRRRVASNLVARFVQRLTSVA